MSYDTSVEGPYVRKDAFYSIFVSQIRVDRIRADGNIRPSQLSKKLLKATTTVDDRNGGKPSSSGLCVFEAAIYFL